MKGSTKMTGKFLGKIDFAEFGTIRDYPFLMGLQLGFTLGNGGAIMDGGKYTVNFSRRCRWDGGQNERNETIALYQTRIYDLLKDAKVNYVSQLVGKPVEVTIENNCFKDFRILTEVL